MAPDGAARTSGLLSQAELERLVAAGDIDTVIVAFTDMQGRLTGKRVAARLFVEDVAAHGAECCNYLLAVDVDMNTVDGYAMSSWETGYGDMVMTPDFSTLRLLPWLPGTALVMADLSWARRQARSLPAPRSILQRAARPARRPGPGGLRRHRTGVHGVRRHLPRRVGGRVPRPDPGHRLQRRLRDARLDPDGAAAARHPARHGRRGHVLRGRQGGVQLRPAGDRVPLRRRAGHLRQPHHLQERRQGDRRPARQEPDVHGEIR